MPYEPGLSLPRNTKGTLLFLAACAVLAAAAGAAGGVDNALGVSLAWLSAAALVLAFVHPWRTSRQFRRLVYAAILGFAALAVLSNVFEAVAWKIGSPPYWFGGPGAAGDRLNDAAAASFLIAILVCTPALVVGAIGAVVTSRRERRSQPD